MNNNEVLSLSEEKVKEFGDSLIKDFSEYVRSTGLRIYSYNFMDRSVFDEYYDGNKYYVVSGESKVNLLKLVRKYIKSKGFKCKLRDIYYSGDLIEASLMIEVKERSLISRLFRRK